MTSRFSCQQKAQTEIWTHSMISFLYFHNTAWSYNSIIRQRKHKYSCNTLVLGLAGLQLLVIGFKSDVLISVPSQSWIQCLGARGCWRSLDFHHVKKKKDGKVVWCKVFTLVLHNCQATVWSGTTSVTHTAHIYQCKKVLYTRHDMIEKSCSCYILCVLQSSLNNEVTASGFSKVSSFTFFHCCNISHT